MNHDSCGIAKSCAWKVATRLRTHPTRICVAMDSNTDPCGRKVYKVIDHEWEYDTTPMLPLCEKHYRHFLRHVRKAVGELESTLRASMRKEVAAKARERAKEIVVEDEKERKRQARRQRTRRGQWVYFARRGDRVKIGYSTQVERRLHNLAMASGANFDRVAITKGNEALEKRYHRRFAEHRLQGEWFAAHPDILAEMDTLEPWKGVAP